MTWPKSPRWKKRLELERKKAEKEKGWVNMGGSHVKCRREIQHVTWAEKKRVRGTRRSSKVSLCRTTYKGVRSGK